MSDKINVEAILKKKLYEHTRPNFAPGIEMCQKGLWNIGVKCPICQHFH